MSTTNILLLGQPATGKTTFTAALWFYVTNWSDELVLKLDTLAQGDHHYLNSIRDEWAKYMTVRRTLLSDKKNQQILMRLLMPSTDKKIVLDIPDFSGEIFKEHFKNREWSVEFDNRLNSVAGIVLFVSTKDPNPTPKYISHVNELADILGQGDYAKSANSNEALVEWNHDFVSSQVKIVDSLQNILQRKKNAQPIKLSIVISAWDKVMIEGDTLLTPKSWFEKTYPLLEQYLDSNIEVFPTKYFGVSAQGGDYENEESMKMLLEKQPLDRIVVQEDSDVSSDITKPILWLLS